MNIQDIEKTGVKCQECGEIMPADLMEGVRMCPECEVEQGIEVESLLDLHEDLT